MINRVHLKTLLSFDAVSLELDSGLVVLSGPSGAGKSLLMGSILSAFGIGSADASVCEVSIDRPSNLHSDAYELDDELVVRSVKKERIRYFLNDQNISKKALNEIFSPYVNYLSVRDSSGFESEHLISTLDNILTNNNKSYKKLLKEYRKRYATYMTKLSELRGIQNREKKMAELIEFATFEIDKIKSIDPKNGEDEELLLLKKQLSRIEKINEALVKAEGIFEMEESISEVFSLSSKDGGYFFDAMNQLRADFEDTQNLARELEETDVEDLLDRLEKITELKNRYGSIDDALEYCAKKEQELAGYQRSEEDKSLLESFLQLEFAELNILARQISQARQAQASKLSAKMKSYLDNLRLVGAEFDFKELELMERGVDSITLEMRGSSVSTLSGGEHNRLRLALMVASIELSGSAEGIIVLDEIDANVSGDESIAIADMIHKLSSYYQIFAISHQPHLAAKATQHILIDKKDGKSRATNLDHDEKVAEIARIIEGETAGDEAIAFAQKLLS